MSKKQAEPIRVMFYSDGVKKTTGYGRITKELATRLAKDTNYDVICQDITDPTPAERIDGYTRLPIYGSRVDPKNTPYFLSFINNMSLFKPDVFIPICDAFFLSRDNLHNFNYEKNGIKLMPYIPIDSNNVADSSQYILDIADKILVQSTFGQEELKKAGYESTVLRHGVDTKKFTDDEGRRNETRMKYGIDEDTTVYLFVGRNSPRKRIESLLRGYADYKQKYPTHKTLLIMHGSEYNNPDCNIPRKIEYESQRTGVNLKESILIPYPDHQLGLGVDEEKIIDLYRACDYTVSMSWGEGCFIAGTKVNTQDGEKNIETINPGNIVLTASGWHKVNATSKREGLIKLIRISYMDGDEERFINCTDNHPFMIATNFNSYHDRNIKKSEERTITCSNTILEEIMVNFVRADELKEQDLLIRFVNNNEKPLLTPIKSIFTYGSQRQSESLGINNYYTTVYNLDVDEDPTYCVEGGIVVHNTGLLALEGFSLGKPTIYPKNSNWKETVGENNERGYAVNSLGLFFAGMLVEQPISNPEHLAEVLAQATEAYVNRDDGKLEYYNKQYNAISWIEENANWDVIVEELKTHIKDVLKQ